VITVTTPKFQLGRLLITPGAQDALAATGESVWTYFARHAQGDWGEVDAEDAAANDEAVKDGSRLLSAYTLTFKNGETQRLWLITEAEDDNGVRVASTALLSSEY
jgi:hypothetical protein